VSWKVRVLVMALLVAAFVICELIVADQEIVTIIGLASPTPTAVPSATSTATDTPLPPSPTPTTTPTAAPTEIPTASPTTTPTMAATDTPTPEEPTATPTSPPVDTPTPTSIPTATPTPTPGLQGKLVFQRCSGCEIYVINADGTGLRQLTDGMDPAWSPDGKRVAFARWQKPSPGIYVIDEDGKNETQVFSSDYPKAPVWSPDGQRLVITHQHGEDNGVPRWKLGVIRVEEKHFAEILCWNHSFSPTWAPDGNIIAYDSDFGLHLTSEDGSIGGETYGKHEHALILDVWATSPAWSPDGSKIAYIYDEREPAEIYLMGPDGENQTKLTDTPPLPDRSASSVAPAWSPDGAKIAFLTDRRGKWEIWVMNADGSDQRPMFETALDEVSIGYEFVGERVISWAQ